jgi:Flp pilus assembly protein TadD
LDLSLLYDRVGRYQDCITAAKRAIQLRPNYPEAYNNIAAAYEDMHQWDEAIAAATQALKLKPDYQLAKNNLAYSLSQKNLKPH